MKRFSLLAAIFFLMMAAPVLAGEAEDLILAMVQAGSGYHDERLHAKMTIHESGGGRLEREMDILRWEGSGQGGARTLVRFTLPADLMNTALLSQQNSGRADDQWLYLPAIRRTKRIVGSGRGGRFAGSHFSYDDLAPFDEKKFSYAKVRSENCGDSVCTVLQATPVKNESSPAHRLIWLDSRRQQLVRTEYLDAKSQVVKTAVFSDFVQSGKYFRPRKIVMTAADGGFTELVVSEIQIPAGLKESDFTERALMR